MSKPPSYTIHRKTYADGRDEFRVQVGRWHWLGYAGYSGGVVKEAHFGVNNAEVARDRATAEAWARSHWRRWLADQPLINHMPEPFDPEAVSQ